MLLHRKYVLELHVIHCEKIPSAYVTKCKTTPTIYVWQTLNRVQVPFVAVEKQVIAYSECETVASVIQLESIVLYFYVRPVRLYYIIIHNFLNGTI
jgi:hypothetical protein